MIESNHVSDFSLMEKTFLLKIERENDARIAARFLLYTFAPLLSKLLNN